MAKLKMIFSVLIGQFYAFKARLALDFFGPLMHHEHSRKHPNNNLEADLLTRDLNPALLQHTVFTGKRRRYGA